jgi:Winged helix DNA-binding domain
MNPRGWIGEWQLIEPQLALQEIARRYLRAYGPATSDDFRFWWGCGKTLAKTLFHSLEAYSVHPPPRSAKGLQPKRNASATSSRRRSCWKMSLPPLPSCSNRGVGSTTFELDFTRKEQWGSELTRGQWEKPHRSTSLQGYVNPLGPSSI